MDAIKYLLLFSLVTNNLTYYGKRNFKLYSPTVMFRGTLFRYVSINSDMFWYMIDLQYILRNKVWMQYYTLIYLRGLFASKYPIVETINQSI